MLDLISNLETEQLLEIANPPFPYCNVFVTCVVRMFCQTWVFPWVVISNAIHWVCPQNGGGWIIETRKWLAALLSLLWLTLSSMKIIMMSTTTAKMMNCCGGGTGGHGEKASLFLLHVDKESVRRDMKKGNCGKVKIAGSEVSTVLSSFLWRNDLQCYVFIRVFRIGGRSISYSCEWALFSVYLHNETKRDARRLSS